METLDKIYFHPQGLMGWYMVKSGLKNNFDDPNDVPRVSQYRLASHLGLAFTLYTLLLWSALDKLLPAQPFPLSAAESASAFKRAQLVRRLAHTSKALVFLTAMSGLTSDHPFICLSEV